MSYFTLFQQLSVEFMTDPTFDKARAREELSALWGEWRQTHGRHLPIEQMSEQFGQWWQSHYKECMSKEGSIRPTYKGFLETLSAKLLSRAGEIRNPATTN